MYCIITFELSYMILITFIYILYIKSKYRIADGFPDSRTCLLHQKLQMLNICMERKRLREGGLPFSMTQKTTSTTTKKKNTTADDDKEDEDSDDEFFDCSNDEDEGE